MSYNNQKRISTDSKGNPYQVISAKQVTDKEGTLIDGAYIGFVELGGKLYSIKTSNAKENDKKGNPRIWMKVTAHTAKKKHSSM